MVCASLCRVVLVSGLVALVAGGVAAQSRTAIGSGDVVADRQRLMKLNGASWRDAQDKFKAGNIEAIAVNAETMAVNAAHIPALFPPGSLTDKSKAKPEIWQRWGEFEDAAKNMAAWATRLRDAAQAKNQPEVEAIMKEYGAKACGTCHQPFRVPPPRS